MNDFIGGRVNTYPLKKRFIIKDLKGKRGNFSERRGTMPIPKRKPNESDQEYLSRLIRFFRKEEKKPIKQAIAIAFSYLKREKEKKKK
jgi:hypothetical protein